MSDTPYSLGKRRWIEAQAAVYQKLRGMSPADAMAKAKELFARFEKADAKRR